MTESTERRALYEKVQLTYAGHPAERVAMVAADSLAAILGFVCDTPEDAERLVDDIAIDMKTLIRSNWSYICDVRRQKAN